MQEFYRTRPRRLSLGKEQAQLCAGLFEGEDDAISLENHTNIGRYDKRRQRQLDPSLKQGTDHTLVKQSTIRARNQDIQAVDFYEKSNFYIHLLREDFATKRGNDWYELNSPVEIEDLEAKPDLESGPLEGLMDEGATLGKEKDYEQTNGVDGSLQIDGDNQNGGPTELDRAPQRRPEASEENEGDQGNEPVEEAAHESASEAPDTSEVKNDAQVKSTNEPLFFVRTEEASEEQGKKRVGQIKIPEDFKKTKKKGRWKLYEHQLFLEALQLYGKDWEQIERHIGTRDIMNIRSHAQKFLTKLVKFLDGRNTIEHMSPEEADYYYGVLNQKIHKSMKFPKVVELPSEDVVEKIFLVTKHPHGKRTDSAQAASAPNQSSLPEEPQATSSTENKLPHPPEKKPSEAKELLLTKRRGTPNEDDAPSKRQKINEAQPQLEAKVVSKNRAGKSALHKQQKHQPPAEGSLPEFKEPVPKHPHEDTSTQKSKFSKWRSSQLGSKKSFSHSIQVKTETSVGNSKKCKFSFKSMFKSGGADDYDSEDSESSQFNHEYDLDNFNSQSKNTRKMDALRILQMKRAFANLSDLETLPEEDPVVLCKLEENGLEFNVMDNITKDTYMKIFYKIHTVGIHRRLPNLYKAIMRKIQRVMEECEPGASNEDDHYVPPFFADIVEKGNYTLGQAPPTVVNAQGHNFQKDQANLVFSLGTLNKERKSGESSAKQGPSEGRTNGGRGVAEASRRHSDMIEVQPTSREDQISQAGEAGEEKMGDQSSSSAPIIQNVTVNNFNFFGADGSLQQAQIKQAVEAVGNQAAHLDFLSTSAMPPPLRHQPSNPIQISNPTEPEQSGSQPQAAGIPKPNKMGSPSQ